MFETGYLKSIILAMCIWSDQTELCIVILHLFTHLQFLERLYDIMVINNEDLTMTVMINAFSNIARL